MPESFKDYRLDNLISIDVEQGNMLKAAFQISGLDDTRTILLEVKKPTNFISEVEKAKKRLEEEKIEFEKKRAQEKKMMVEDEKMQKLQKLSIETLEKKLKELENKAKDLDIAYATGRISKETYLEKMKR